MKEAVNALAERVGIAALTREHGKLSNEDMEPGWNERKQSTPYTWPWKLHLHVLPLGTGNGKE